ncbi:MAG: choice-of-anchor D domain-containing protein [Longimicrobiales bacterium]|nr:choice-of-anchor D domain-containing protein [Longimicrobiales bacterium]
MRHTHSLRACRRILAVLALPTLFLAACDNDEDPMMVRTGEIAASLSADQFADTDPQIGTDETISVDVTNSGTSSLNITGIALGGPDAGSFTLVGAEAGELGGGATLSFDVAFAPASVGTKNATLFISSDNANPIEAPISGTATRFQFTQVDRKGIPGLNTVFNHPSGTGPFDKTAYNTASPATDVANYTDLFITVLEAVPNSDPQGTAALLLPDELPVSLAASPTAFASLTGRALSDDATDVALFVVINDEPSLQSDNVDANDKAFRAEFPYVAAPHN